MVWRNCWVVITRYFFLNIKYYTIILVKIQIQNLAPRRGLEPRTSTLTVSRNYQLCYRGIYLLVRVAGIEPARPLQSRDFKSLASTYFTTLALPLIDSTHCLWRRADFGVGCVPSWAIAVVMLGLIDGPISPSSICVHIRYPLNAIN